MSVDGSLFGFDAALLQGIATALALVLAIVLFVLGRRARQPMGGALALAAGVSAITSIPGPDTGLLALALAGTTLLFLLTSPLFARIGASRVLRAIRVSLLRMPRRAFDALVFVLVVSFALALSFALFDGEAVIQDSQAQLFHARILALGHVTLPSPACADHLLADHVIVAPRLYSQYPPGHIAVLALGVLLHAPFVVAPILGGSAILAIGALARELHGERTARRAMLLGLVSPFVLLMSSEAMSHATGLLVHALALLAFVRFRRTGSLVSAIAMGALFGGLLLTRPITAIALALPVAVLLLADAWGAREKRAGVLVAAIVGASVGALLLVWNQETNGSPFLMGYVVRWGPLHTFGFHDTPWGDPHTPLLGLLHTFSNDVGWNAYLFGGPIPAAFLVVLGLMRDRRSGMAWVLALAPVAILAVHAFYFFQDLIFGPRYLYEATAGALILASRGIGSLSLGGRSHRVLGGQFVALAIAVSTFWPYAIWSYHVGYCPRGGLVDRTEIALGAAGATGPIVVFVDEPYERAFYTVDPDLNANRVLFLRDLGDERDAACVEMLPGRDPWRVRDGELGRLGRD